MGEKPYTCHQCGRKCKSEEVYFVPKNSLDVNKGVCRFELNPIKSLPLLFNLKPFCKEHVGQASLGTKDKEMGEFIFFLGNPIIFIAGAIFSIIFLAMTYAYAIYTIQNSTLANIFISFILVIITFALAIMSISKIWVVLYNILNNKRRK
ncbi:MAG: hypothetical protein ABIH83_01635 [Candidatus Micrarchaeota archaeon]